jgi:tetratricopeptide (TPR) repeat protein
VQAYIYRGKAYVDLRQPARALDDLDRAIGLDGASAEAYRVRGRARNGIAVRGHYQEAEQDYRMASKLRPDYALAYSDMANLYRVHRGNLGKQIMDFYDKSVELDPSNPLALNERGAYRTTWEDLRAFDDFNKAIALKPDFAEAYGNRAMASLILNHDSVAAQKDFAKCFELKPERRMQYLLDAEMSKRILRSVKRFLPACTSRGS